ncbi:LEAF RUST 10 DISEASE-RESISTANCE LOCUS RECEPTOR-LIKE PROTEIN KINASE-like 2.1 [Impatiens glandulifera]|uniref:LEAF RUST 10 DISEASE-RESISTANCE LOCUS RECEPTOR-LIKE PROTEIN KINASE-like 2.1 n=1 Tax=Impatiens glandulifera TaxID=253017 RepID=UPI001FB0CFB3|nr:LEAF RUST 10 DISEASE-RESISTANCE LOCUS RECEPTOR-LIKE PROTEIN KINASE-like 2.1 [Impatiens glandulifera]
MLDRCFFRLLSIILLVVSVISHANSQNNLYEDCKKQFQCGKIADLGYPFWGGNRQESCGHPSFKLNCTTADSQPTITIQSWDYRILDINNPSKSITVARNEFVDNSTCPTSPQNATLDNTLFNYAADVANLTLYYDCIELKNNTCDTAANNTSFNFYVSTSASNRTNTVLGCNSSAIVQVNQTSGEALLSNSSSIEVTEAIDSGFGLVWSANDEACRNCVKSKGVCGSNANNAGAFICHCPDGDDSEICGSNRFPLGMTLGIGLPIILLLVLGIILGVYFFKRKRNGKTTRSTTAAIVAGNTNVEQFMKNYGANVPKRYSYRQIEKITKSFVDKQGQGGFGTVYKGKLPSGQLVAVKLLKEEGGDSRDFMNEVESISVTSHVNVVSLLGFCYQGKKRALVYEFMPNGSLDRFICDDPSLRLELKLLYQIVIGIARGLEYLHQGCATRIVHFDIKPHNILLDEEFCPKISDFGLAKLCKKRQSTMSTMDQRGTIGYIAPEVSSRAFGKASHKSDVYSYGMMVLEMVGAKEIKDDDQTSEVYFPDCIYKRVVKGKDLQLPNATTEEEKELGVKMILVGLWCIQINPLQRPSMCEVVKMLEGNVDAMEIPPEPFKFSPSRAVINDSSDSSSLLSGIQSRNQE